MSKFVAVNFLALLLLVGCSDDGSESTTPDAIWIGAWVDTIEATGCETVLTMRTDNTFLWSSLDERQSGTWAVSELETEVDAYLLELNFLEDNGLANCDGDSVDDTGLLTTTMGFPDVDTMTWSVEGAVVITFLRDL